MYGAFAGAIAARNAGAREASPGHFPMKRFHHAAAWIWTLLVDSEASPIHLVRLIHAGPEPGPRPAELRVQFDASTSGGGRSLVGGRGPGRVVRGRLGRQGAVARSASYRGRLELANTLGIPHAVL